MSVRGTNNLPIILRIFKKVSLLSCLFALITAFFVTVSPIKAATINGGWTAPLDPMPNISADFLASGCNGSTEYPLSNKYHLGNDYPKEKNKPVYAIGDGTVLYAGLFSMSGIWADAIFILHQAGDENEFVALYGHINKGLDNGDPVTAGDIIGTIADLTEAGDHLHFGIRPGTTYPNDNRGTMPCPNPHGPLTDTNGYVDPMPYLAAHTEGTPTPTPTPAPIPEKMIQHPNGARAYYATNGTKRFVPSGIESCLGGAANTISITQAQWETIPTDSIPMSCSFPGEIIKHPNGAYAYVQYDGTKRFVPSTVATCIGSGARYTTVPQATWEDISTNSTNMTCAEAFYGRIIKHPNGAYAYVQLNGTKKFVPSGVEGCFGGAANAIAVAQSTWESIPTVSGNMSCNYTFSQQLIQHPNGAYAYVQANGTKRFVPSVTIAACFGGIATKVSDSVWNSISTTTPDMTCAEGLYGKILQHPNGAHAYVQLNGTKKFVPSGVEACLGGTSNIKIVSQSVWEAIPTEAGDMTCE